MALWYVWYMLMPGINLYQVLGNKLLKFCYPWSVVDETSSEQKQKNTRANKTSKIQLHKIRTRLLLLLVLVLPLTIL